MFELLLEGQKGIHKEIKRVHSRLDEISEKAIVNEQSIKHLKETLNEEKQETKERFDIVHKSIRHRDKAVKWFFATIIVPIVGIIAAVVKISIK